MPAATWPDLPESLASALAKTNPAAFGAALDAQIASAWAGLANGIAAYRAHSYYRGAEKARPVWKAGNSTLYDHGNGSGGVPTLFVPSLINRGWVLDLIPGKGMLSGLAQSGVHPYRLEWGAPGDEGRHFDIAGYVENRLLPALDETVRLAGGPVVLVGYCMGGLLALLAAIRRPEALRGLALLAMPWDFHAEAPERAQAMATIYRALRPMVAPWGELPVDAVQAFFASQDPILALRKFRHFAALDQSSAEAQNFVALEDWLNDGIPVALPTAEEALLRWYADNEPGRGVWRPGGVLVDPAALAIPTLVVVPGTDKIVPPVSAAAIIGKFRRAARLDPPLGHIGMVVGRRAEAALWKPLAEWIGSLAKPASRRRVRLPAKGVAT